MTVDTRSLIHHCAACQSRVQNPPALTYVRVEGMPYQAGLCAEHTGHVPYFDRIGGSPQPQPSPEGNG